MTTYYVKPDGNDGSSGQSEANAWQTIDRARQIGAGGNDFFFRTDASYVKPSGTWRIPAGSTVGSYGGGSNPVLESSPRVVFSNGSVTAPNSGSPDDMLWHDGVEQIKVTQMPTQPGEYWHDGTTLHWIPDSDPDVGGIWFSGDSGLYQMLGSDTTLFNVDVMYGAYSSPMVTGDYNVLQTEVTLDGVAVMHGRHHGFQQFGAAGSTYNLSNSQFMHHRLNCAALDNLPVVYIDGCEFGFTFGMSWSTGLNLHGQPDSVVRKSDFHHCRSDGCGLSSASVGVLVELCDSYNNGIGQDDRAGYTNFGKQNEFRYNKARDNGTDTAEQQGTGFQNDFGHEDAFHHYNIATGNQSAGFAFADGGGPGGGDRVYNCVMDDNGRPGAAYGTFGVTVYGNNVNGLKIKNCAIKGSERAISDNGSTFPQSTGVDIDYNCYDLPVKWGGTIYPDMVAFGAATGNESHGVFADPEFVDSANGNYRPQSTSPCIDAGLDVGLTRDFAGGTVPQ